MNAWYELHDINVRGFWWDNITKKAREINLVISKNGTLWEDK
jgi:hypothetical protein